MPSDADKGRINQRLRTRKDLLQGAARLLKQGRAPTMEDVAAEALVSRATAYRYFPSLDALLTEAPLDGSVPDPSQLFTDDRDAGPAERLDKAEGALHEMIYRNETRLRAFLANTLAPRPPGTEPTPARQNRRTALIDAALAPARHRFDEQTYDRLCAALALIFGIESMVVFQDVLGVDEAAARRIKSWAIHALVRAALDLSTA